MDLILPADMAEHVANDKPSTRSGTVGMGQNELASALRKQGRVVIRATTDAFHRPRAARLERGPTSADGYFLDSHQVDRIVNELLVPFRKGADEVLVAAFDEPTDTALEIVTEVAADAVLVFDGLFLHRDEFAELWDVSVYLDADERRDAEWLQFLLDDLPADSTSRATELDRRLDTARWPRYRHGWSSYIDSSGIRDQTQQRAVGINQRADPQTRILQFGSV